MVNEYEVHGSGVIGMEEDQYFNGDREFIEVSDSEVGNGDTEEIEQKEEENIETETDTSVGEEIGVSEEEGKEDIEVDSELAEKAEKLKEEMSRPDVVSTINFAMVDNEGNVMNPRTENGGMRIAVLNIHEDIVKTRRARTEPDDLFSLQEQLLKFGQLQPIHVVMHGGKYLLLDGWRRLQALANIGVTDVTAVVDETIPSEMVKYFEPIINGVRPYSFNEKLSYGTFFKGKQPNVSYETIEGILGLRMGEFLKCLYIDTMKPEYPDVYKQVTSGKLSIEQGFKKLEKEKEKREKEEEMGVDELNSGEMDEKLRSTDELVGMQNEAHQQKINDRKILDPVLRRSVESRDSGYCQCCSYGKGEPDLMGVFNVHHIVAVQYGGHDNKSNLILLCNNCHTLVHDYEKGRFLPEKSTYDRLSSVKKIVVLGNMLVTLRKRAIEHIRTKHVETGRVMDAGKITIGQALNKHSVDLGGEAYFNNSPYQTFLDSVADLDYGGGVRGELGGISYEVRELDIHTGEEVEVVQEEEKGITG